MAVLCPVIEPKVTGGRQRFQRMWCRKACMLTSGADTINLPAVSARKESEILPLVAGPVSPLFLRLTHASTRTASKRKRQQRRV